MSSILRQTFLAALATTSSIMFGAETGLKLTYEQIEKFLQDAKIVSTHRLSAGATNSQRVRLRDGALEHDAHLQCIDVSKHMFQGVQGTEMNFRDTWKFNVAAYRLGRILELNMIPVSIERTVNGAPCAVTWWLDNTMMEADRITRKLQAPDSDSWNREMHIVRVFDQLIYNTDRNLQNLLIDPEWRIWMIDHTRAFRLYLTVKETQDLVECDRRLLAKLQALDTNSLQPLKPYLNDLEIKGLVARRDVIVKLFNAKVKLKGEAAVLYDRPSR